MYIHGGGVKQDYSKAAEWYRKAAKQGHEKAQYSINVLSFEEEDEEMEDYSVYGKYSRDFKMAHEAFAAGDYMLSYTCASDVISAAASDGKWNYVCEAVKLCKAALNKKGDFDSYTYKFYKTYTDIREGEALLYVGREREGASILAKYAKNDEAHAAACLAYYYKHNGNRSEFMKWFSYGKRQWYWEDDEDYETHLDWI